MVCEEEKNARELPNGCISGFFQLFYSTFFLPVCKINVSCKPDITEWGCQLGKIMLSDFICFSKMNGNNLDLNWLKKLTFCDWPFAIDNLIFSPFPSSHIEILELFNYNICFILYFLDFSDCCPYLYCYIQRFRRCALQFSSGFSCQTLESSCRNQEPLENFELNPLF